MMEQLNVISTAYADTLNTPAGQQQGGGLSFLVMFGIFFIFIYFAIWRPQNKRAKEQQNLLAGLAKGDEVITAGGLYGRIAKLKDQAITLTLTDNVDIIMQKSAVVTVLPKGTLKSLE